MEPICSPNVRGYGQFCSVSGILIERVTEEAAPARGHAGALSFHPPRAGAISYLRYAWPVNSTELVTRLRDEHGVLVVPGDHFGMDGFLRIGYGGDPDDLRRGLRAIDAYVSRLPRP